MCESWRKYSIIPSMDMLQECSLWGICKRFSTGRQNEAVDKWPGWQRRLVKAGLAVYQMIERSKTGKSGTAFNYSITPP